MDLMESSPLEFISKSPIILTLSSIPQEISQQPLQISSTLNNDHKQNLIAKKEENSNNPITQPVVDSGIKCLSCGELFEADVLFAHIKTHLRRGQKECSLCPYKSIASGDLRDHMNKHYGIKPYKCEFCSNSYTWQSGWKKHLSTHRQSNTTQLSNNIQLHKNKSRYSSRFKTPNSENTTSSSSSSTSLIHKAPEKTTVDFNNSLLNQNKREEKCLSCGGTVDWSDLPNHIRTHIHANQKNCTLCNYKSTTTLSLIEHYNVHYGINPFSCYICHMRFPTQKCLKTHKEESHESLKRFCCEICSKKFVRSAHLRTHEKIHDRISSKLIEKNNGLEDKCERMIDALTTQEVLSSESIPKGEIYSNYNSWEDGGFNWNDESFYSPLVKSDVEWTQSIPSSPSKGNGSHCSDSSSLPNSLSSTTTTIHSNSIVQDLWTELQSDTFNSPFCFGETYSADGIPITTELAPFEGFSYTEFLNYATSDLPFITNIQNDDMNPSVLNSVDETIWKESNIQSTDDQEGLIECKNCGECVGERDLLSHIRNHLRPGQRTCDLCGRTYCNALVLKEHIHVHYNLKPYTCSVCNEAFPTRYTLKTHQIFIHEGGKAIECPFPDCGKLFAMKSELQKHYRSHQSKNELWNEDSSHNKGKRRKRKEEEDEVKKDVIEESTEPIEMKLKEEQAEQEIQNDTPLIRLKKCQVELIDIAKIMTKKCPFCKDEIGIGEFMDHKHRHENGCHICGKMIRIGNVLEHGASHVGLNLNCEMCGWRARQRSSLWEHMNSHLGVRPLPCLLCANYFPSRRSLRSHTLSIHSQLRPFGCEYCGKSFAEGKCLRDHQLIHYGRTCPFCSIQFPKRTQLKLHLRQNHQNKTRKTPQVLFNEK